MLTFERFDAPADIVHRTSLLEELRKLVVSAHVSEGRNERLEIMKSLGGYEVQRAARLEHEQCRRSQVPSNHLMRQSFDHSALAIARRDGLRRIKSKCVDEPVSRWHLEASIAGLAKPERQTLIESTGDVGRGVRGASDGSNTRENRPSSHESKNHRANRQS